MDTDSGLGSILFMGWVGYQICEILCIQIWIQYCLWVGSDFKSVKSYGFGFWFGFNVVHGLGQISNPWNLMDSDSGLDSILFMGWVGLWICFFARIWIWFRIHFFTQTQIRIRESESADLYCQSSQSVQPVKQVQPVSQAKPNH